MSTALQREAKEASHEAKETVEEVREDVEEDGENVRSENAARVVGVEKKKAKKSRSLLFARSKKLLEQRKQLAQVFRAQHAPGAATHKTTVKQEDDGQVMQHLTLSRPAVRRPKRGGAAVAKRFTPATVDDVEVSTGAGSACKDADEVEEVEETTTVAPLKPSNPNMEFVQAVSEYVGEARFKVEEELYEEYLGALESGVKDDSARMEAVVGHFAALQVMEEEHAEAVAKCSASSAHLNVEVAQSAEIMADSFGGVWASLHEDMLSQRELEAEHVQHLRSRVLLPVQLERDDSDAQLAELFSEARCLHERANELLAVANEAKAVAAAGTEKRTEFERELKRRMTSSEDASKLRELHVGSFKQTVHAVECETAFRAALYRYELRLPEIISAVKALQAKRLDCERAAVQQYVNVRRAHLQQLLRSLDRIEQRVQEVDMQDEFQRRTAASDAFERFAEMRVAGPAPMVQVDMVERPKPPTRPQLRATVSSIGDSLAPMRELAAKQRRKSVPQPQAAVSPPRPLQRRASTPSLPSSESGVQHTHSYAHALWGKEGFAVAHAQATEGKATMKQVFQLLESWATVYRLKSEQMGKLLKDLPPSLSMGATETESWESLVTNVSTQVQQYSELSARLHSRVLELRTLKSGQKRQALLLLERRETLERALQTRRDEHAKAQERLKGLQCAVAALRADVEGRKVTSQGELAQLLKKLAAANEAFYAGDKDVRLAREIMEAANTQYQLCMAHFLNLYQAQEEERQTAIRDTLLFIVSSLDDVIARLNRQDIATIAYATALDIERDLSSLVSASPAGDGSPSVEFMGEYTTKGLVTLKLLVQLATGLAAVEEQHAKHIAKHIPNFVPDSSSPSVQAALQSAQHLMSKMVEFLDEQVFALRDVVAPQVHERRKELKQRVKEAQNSAAAVQKTLAAAESHVAKVRAAEQRAVDGFEAIKEKFLRTQGKVEGGKSSVKKLDKRKELAHASEQKVEQAQAATREAEAELARVEAECQAQLNEIVDAMRASESERGQYLRWTMNSILGHRRSHLKRFREQTSVLKVVSERVDTKHDVETFAREHATGQSVPANVGEHAKLLEAFQSLEFLYGDEAADDRTAALNEEASTPAAFGAPLRDTERIPEVPIQCMAFLRRSGLSTTGLFRVPGSQTEIRALRRDFEDHKMLSLDSQYSPHAVADVLKMYLRELPQPLITEPVRGPLLRVAEIDKRNVAGRVQTFKRVLGQLPRPNLLLLDELMTFLAQVAQFSSENRMTASSLAVVIAPNIVSNMDSNATISQALFQEMGQSISVVDCLIQECEYVFPL